MECKITEDIIKKGIVEKIQSEATSLQGYEKVSETSFISDEDAIPKMNKLFNYPVLKHIDGIYNISVDDGILTRSYLESSPKILSPEDYKKLIFSDFNADSLNLQNPELWLHAPTVQQPTLKKLVDFCIKLNPNFRIEILENLPDNAIADITNFVIKLKDRESLKDIPEEVVHFFVELLPDNHPLKIRMVNEVVNFSIYKDTFNEYKDHPLYQINGSVNIPKIKREAVTKLITQYINSEFSEEVDKFYSPKQKSFLRSIVDLIIKAIRRLMHENMEPIYYENIGGNPFNNVSEMILSGDTSLLDTKKIPSIYDDLFASKLTESIPEVHNLDPFLRSLSSLASNIQNKFHDELNNEIFNVPSDPTKDTLKGLREFLLREENLWSRMYIERLGNLLHDTISKIKYISSSESRSYLQDIKTALDLLNGFTSNLILVEHYPIAINQVLNELEKQDILQDAINHIPTVKSMNNIIKAVEDVIENFNSSLDGSSEMLKSIQRELLRTEPKSVQYDIESEITKIRAKLNNSKTSIQNSKNKIGNALTNLLNSVLQEEKKDVLIKEEERLKKLENTIKYNRNVKKFNKQLVSSITSRRMLEDLVRGREFFLTPELRKTFDSMVADLSTSDYIRFYTTSPSLMHDDFITSVYIKYFRSMLTANAKSLSDFNDVKGKLFPLKKKLMDKYGLSQYEADKVIFDLQSFNHGDDVVKRRVLLDKRNYHDYFQQVGEKNKIVKNLYIERSNLEKEMGALSLEGLDQAQLDKITNEKIEELNKISEKIKEAEKDLTEFKEKYGANEFTKEFLSKVDGLFGKNDDSFKNEKFRLRNRIRELQEMSDSGLLTGSMSYKEYMDILNEITILQQFLSEVQNKNSGSKNFFEEFENLYELDEGSTNHEIVMFRLRMKEEIKRQVGESAFDEAMLDSFLGRFYALDSANKDYYDYISSLYERISEIRGDKKNEYIESSIKNIQAKINKLKKDYSTNRGEFNIISMESLPLEIDGVEYDAGAYLKLLYLQLDYFRVLQNVNKNSSNETEDVANLSFIIHQMRENAIPSNLKDFIPSLAKYLNINSETEAQELINIIGSSDPDVGWNLIESLIKDPKLKEKINNSREGYKMLFDDNLLEDYLKLNSLESSGLSEADKKEISEIYSKIDKSSIKYPTFEYTQFLMQLKSFYEDVYSKIPYDAVYEGKPIQEAFSKYTEKFNRLFYGSSLNSTTIDDIKDFYSDDFFEFLLHLTSKYQPSLYQILRGAHVQKTVRVFIPGYSGTLQKKEWNISRPYVRTVPVESHFRKDEYPPQFRKYRVRDVSLDGIKLRRDRIPIDDERVLRGEVEPTVTLDGKDWLPTNGFENEKYKILTSSNDQKSKDILEYLAAFKREFYKIQRDNLTPSMYYDSILPLKMADAREKTFSKARGTAKQLKDIKNILKSNEDDPDTRVTQENLKLKTIININRRTGELIDSRVPKLKTARYINVDRSSDDMMATFEEFIHDVNEFSAKSEVLPFAETMLEVLRRANDVSGGRYHKKRIATLSALIEQTFLDIIPKGGGNSNIIGTIISMGSNVASYRLMADIVGAGQNWIGGITQQMIEAFSTKSEALSFSRSITKSSIWAGKYLFEGAHGEDFSASTQMAIMFGFLPEPKHLSRKLNKQSWLFDIRSHLQIPRAPTEIDMAMRLGLMILNENPITVNGKKMYISDLYDLDQDKKLRIKPQYQTQDIIDKYDPIKGKEIQNIRLRISQKYILLQGNYKKMNQSQASYYAIGRAALLFKKWLPSSIDRRWSGKYFDSYLQEFRAGYHYVVWRLGQALLNSILTTGGLEKYKEYKVVSNLEDMALKSVIRTTVEAAMILALGMTTYLGFGYDKDDPDRNKKLSDESYIHNLALLITMRAYGEVGTFIPLPMFDLGFNEAKRALNLQGLLQTMFVDQIATVLQYGALETASLLGNESATKKVTYQKDGGPRYGMLFGQNGYKAEGDSKFWASVQQLFGFNGYTYDPEKGVKLTNLIMNRIK